MNNQEYKCPCGHKNCLMTAIKAFRNAIYYVGRIRFTHTLVINLLFRKVPLKDKIKNILELTYEHCKNVSLYAFFYKIILCLVCRLMGNKKSWYSFFVGMLVGHYTYGNDNIVNYQLYLHLLSRCSIESVSNVMRRNNISEKNYNFYPYISIFLWGFSIFLFEDDKKSFPNSLRGSLKYIYKDSDKDYKNWREIIPFDVAYFEELLFK